MFAFLLNEIPFSKRPVVLSFDWDEPEPQQKLQALEDYLRQKKIHPLFPYPIYIITKQEIYSEQINIIKDEAQLPEYFMIPDRKLDLQEKKIFYKVSILAEKVRNVSLGEKFQLLKTERDTTKKLFMVSREAQYYENLLKLMEGQ